MKKKFSDYLEIVTSGNFAMPANVCSAERAEMLKKKKKKNLEQKASRSFKVS